MECLVCGESISAKMKRLSGSRANTCSNCGSFVVPRMYSVSLNREEIDREFIELVMLCREFDVEDIDSVKRIYRSSYINLYRTSRYNTSTLSVLALHIYMNNNNMISPLKEYCKYMGVRPASVNSLLKKLEPTDIFKKQDWEGLVSNLQSNLGFSTEAAKKTLSLIELLDEKIEINMNILSACIYRATNLSLRKVARAFYISRQTVLKYNEKLEEII